MKHKSLVRAAIFAIAASGSRAPIRKRAAQSPAAGIADEAWPTCACQKVAPCRRATQRVAPRAPGEHLAQGHDFSAISVNTDRAARHGLLQARPLQHASSFWQAIGRTSSGTSIIPSVRKCRLLVFQNVPCSKEAAASQRFAQDGPCGHGRVVGPAFSGAWLHLDRPACHHGCPPLALANR